MTRTSFASVRPRVLLGMAESAWSEALADQLRRRGVRVSQTTHQSIWLRKLRRPDAPVLVLPAERGWESGFLLAAKLLRTRPDARIVVVGGDARAERLGLFVGAVAVVPLSAGVAAVSDAVWEALPVAR